MYVCMYVVCVHAIHIGLLTHALRKVRYYYIAEPLFPLYKYILHKYM